MSVCALAAGAILAGTLIADSKQHVQTRHDNGLHARFVRADLAKNTITFQTTDKAGKSTEMTMPMAKNARILGENSQPVSFTTFTNNLQKEKDKSILVIEDSAGRQVMELRDLPNHVAGR
jgi:hypothetical protein